MGNLLYHTDLGLFKLSIDKALGSSRPTCWTLMALAVTVQMRTWA